MQAPAALLKGAASLTRGAQCLGSAEGRSLLSALEALRLREEAAPTAPSAEPQEPELVKADLRKTLTFYIGADLHLPVADNRYVMPQADPEVTAALKEGVRRDPFEGVPLRALAERIGDRLMPAYEVMMAEQQRAKQAEREGSQEPRPLHVPNVPHMLPFTRWAASNKTIQSTFIAEDAKKRKRARLSWYNPYDGMVPSGWLKEGLLKDLDYYFFTK